MRRRATERGIFFFIASWLGVGIGSLCWAESDGSNAATAEVTESVASEQTIEQAQAVQPTQPVQPVQPTQPVLPTEPEQPLVAGPGGGYPVGLSSIGGAELLAPPEEFNRISNSTKPSASVQTGNEAPVLGATDTGDLVGSSSSSTGVFVQRRTPISTDPRVRGYHVGQLMTQADGAYWFPARQDLDTMLSKLDSSIVRDLIILKGPYSTRYGPGFSFMDIVTTGTPRYQNGYEMHGRTGFNFQTNGEQFYGRQTIWGGSSDYGYRIGYGIRTGNDYESGDGTDIPSSYKSRDLDAAFGFDLSPDSRIELGYLRLDQTDTEYPGQFYDIEFLVTDAFNLRYTLENQHYFDLLTVDAWYNRTRFEGNSQRTGKRRQIPELNSPNNRLIRGGILNFTGFTDVDEMSTGFRTAATWGLPNDPQLTFGVDLRYLEQELNEFDAWDAPPFSFGNIGNFGIPRSHSSNPGIFIEQILPLSDRLRVTSGLRVDWVSTDTEGRMAGRTNAEIHNLLATDALDQNFGLWSGFVTAEYDINDCWTLLGGAGHAERPPTLTELYAMESFLAILQQGTTQVRGNPHLHMERMWQVDLGLRGEYDRFRGGINGFHSWVIDYITYATRDDVLRQAGVENALGVQFVNTDLATLAGGEIYGEFDLTCCLTPFATLSYVEGRDHSRGNRGRVTSISGSDEEPLPGISPLESRLGIRWHEPGDEPAWGVELSARIVDNQDRVASSLLEQQSAGFTTWDVRGYMQATEDLTLVAGLENFTDKDYREHLDLLTGNGVRRPGINFYFGAELTY